LDSLALLPYALLVDYCLIVRKLTFPVHLVIGKLASVDAVVREAKFSVALFFAISKKSGVDLAI